ncbi:MAG: patatin-like phospholipase family protein, partial [Candidatus Nanopelagicales bacterium]
MSRKRTPKRGLVLGAGGVLGAAWAVGALCALEEVHGFDPRDAEVIIGTSAGSVLAALLGGGVSASQLRDHQLGIPVSDGPLAGFSWDYEKATTQRPGVPR